MDYLKKKGAGKWYDLMYIEKSPVFSKLWLQNLVALPLKSDEPNPVWS